MELFAEALPHLAPEVAGYLTGALAFYGLGLLAISIWSAKKVQNETDYLIAGRRLPLALAFGTLMATWFGAATINAAATEARDNGVIGVILDPLACSATLVFAGLFFAKPLWRMNLCTMGDSYRKVYGPRAEVLGASIQVPSYFAWIAVQYTALAHYLEAYYNIPLNEGILWVAGLTMAYTLVGGMWSVTLTDTLQIVVALVGLVVLAVAMFAQPALGDGNAIRGIGVMPDKVAAVKPGHLSFLPSAGAVAVMGWIGAWATGMFGNIPGQDLQQRVFASKDEKTAARACLLAGVLYFLFGLIPVGLTLASIVTDPDIEGNPLPYLAERYLSPGMTVLFIVAVVSMIVSTATSALLAPATLLAHNLMSRFGGLTNHPLLRDRLCVVIVSGGGITLAMAGESLMGLLDIALSIQLVALVIPVVAGI